MELTAPTAFTEEFLSGLDTRPVRYLYGSVAEEPSGRATEWLPQVDLEQMAGHISHAAERGIGFLYTLNARCGGNAEFTGEGQRWLAERLGWLEEVGAAGVVATNPYVVEMVRRRFPALRVHVSTLADVDSVEKARFFQGLGVDAIYLPEYVNRDFRLLRAVRKEIEGELVLTVNLGCLLHCPVRDYHASYISHSADSLGHGCYLDYSLARCTAMKAADPVEMVKAPWIRPEDLKVYEQLGFSRFKIAGREQCPEWVLRAVGAYSDRRYDGDLNDLVTQLDALEPFGSLPVRLDNRRLDGFIKGFMSRDCRLGCRGCDHCPGWARRALSVGEGLERYNTGIERFLRRFTTGAFRVPVTRP